jgi:hypothetical protein
MTPAQYENELRRQRHWYAKKRAQHPDRVVCPDCGVYFVGIQGLRVHRGRWHGGRLIT